MFAAPKLKLQGALCSMTLAWRARVQVSRKETTSLESHLSTQTSIAWATALIPCHSRPLVVD